jgi:hypothetical protein
MLLYPIFSFDLRDENFTAIRVTQEDVFHANKRDIDMIFKVSGTAIHRTISLNKPLIRTSVLIKCPTSSERQKERLKIF